MSNKNISPIVHANARTLKLVHPGYHRNVANEHGDLFLLIMLSFLAYGLFFYFIMPTVSPAQYTKLVAELTFYWQSALDSFEYRYYTSYLPYFSSLLQEVMGLIGR